VLRRAFPAVVAESRGARTVALGLLSAVFAIHA
jgi:hypothetical protein